MNNDYLDKNKALWNARTDIHVDSDFYNMSDFLSGSTSLNTIELALLGDVRGKKILHLQCHFGQDTISLARMGASVTGIDLSDVAIEKAQKIVQQLDCDARFICTDVYNLPNVLNDTFDIVFTSYGTIGWLPDLDKWAHVVNHFLKPGGTFVFAEFHPVVWMFDDDFKNVGYNYFNAGPIIETQEGTYTDPTAEIRMEYVGWNHGIGEVLTSLLQHGLALTSFQEFDHSPYNCFRNTIEFEPKKYRIQHLDNKIPMVYSLSAVK